MESGARVGATAVLWAGLLLVTYWWAAGGGITDLGGAETALTSLARLGPAATAGLILDGGRITAVTVPVHPGDE